MATGGWLLLLTMMMMVVSSQTGNYTVSEKTPTPKHVKITLRIENDSLYFSLYDEKPSICNGFFVKFHDNQPVHC